MKSYTVIALATASWAGSTLACDPFRNAELAPADVDVYVHVEDAAQLRAQLQGRPIGKWIEAWLARGQLPEAWARLAEATGLSREELFDVSLGRQATLLWRRGADTEGGPASAEWVMLTEIDPPRSRALLHELSARVVGPRHDVTVFELPGHELVMARAAHRVLVAPAGQAALFHEVVPNLTAPAKRCLAVDVSVKAGRQLGEGTAAVLVRHEPPLGGWSVAVAGLQDGEMSIRHTSRFENAPFRSPVTSVTWDPKPILCLEQSMFVGYIEPTDVADGPLDAFVSATLGEPLLTSVLGPNLGPRRITAVAEVEGRLEQPAFDLLLPTFARVYEVRDAELAWTQVDGHMVRLVTALNRLGQGAFELPVPDPATFAPRQPRGVNIGPLAAWLAGEIPGVGQVSLNWTVVESRPVAGRMGPDPCESWCVIATDPEHLLQVADAMARLPECEPEPMRCDGAAVPAAGRWTNWGAADGRRFGQALGTWAAQAEQLAAPGEEHALRDALSLVRELSFGVDRARWRLARPSEHCVSVDVEVTLSPAESAEPQTP